MIKLKILLISFKDMANNIIPKFSKLLFILSGIFSVIWILWRLITKPSRATYPCIQAAYPIASSFMLYLTSLAVSIFSFRYSSILARKSKYLLSFLFLIASFVFGIMAIQTDKIEVLANVSNSYNCNNPIGSPQGIIPGRVVWSHNPNSTNENWNSGMYFTNHNTNADTVDAMITSSILTLTGASSIEEAWNSLFVYFNKTHGKGAVSYQEGEYIFIKCNFVTAFEQDDEGTGGWTTPQVLLSILDQLVYNLSIPQENIAFGDPMNCVINSYWEMIHSEFPDVIYIDYYGTNGRTLAKKGTQADIFYSDRGEILRDSNNDWGSEPNSGDPVFSDTLYKVIEDADYMINIATLKAHGRSGITLTAKNHFGSHVRTTAAHLHMGLVKPGGNVTRYGYGQYRVLVDLMGHKMLGGNTILFIIDGLWGAPGVGSYPQKFNMSPFNGDYTSSIFMSQDQVALESVCLDFLQAEYPNGKPQYEGVDDYLHQAADSTFWPNGIIYDPENDGTPLTSLGVHEHWNNATEKQYSVELGLSSIGIDFVTATNKKLTAVHNTSKNGCLETDFMLAQNYPNPFNPSTTIRYTLGELGRVSLKIYNLAGKEIVVLVEETMNAGQYEVKWRPNGLPSGIYFYRLQAGQYSETRELLYLK